MRGDSLLQGRIWTLLAIAVVLMAGHGVILYYFRHISSFRPLSLPA
jgi:hypothetical protein